MTRMLASFGDKVTIRNYENRRFVYHEPREWVPVEAHTGTNGRSPGAAVVTDGRRA